VTVSPPGQAGRMRHAPGRPPCRDELSVVAVCPAAGQAACRPASPVELRRRRLLERALGGPVLAVVAGWCATPEAAGAAGSPPARGRGDGAVEGLGAAPAGHPGGRGAPPGPPWGAGAPGGHAAGAHRLAGSASPRGAGSPARPQGAARRARRVQPAGGRAEALLRLRGARHGSSDYRGV